MICFCAHEVCNNRFRWPPPLVGYGTEHIDVFVPFQAETPDLKTSQPSQGLFFQFRWHTELCRWFAYHWFITIIYSWPFHVMYIYEQLPGSHWITISSCGCIDSSSTEEVWPLKLWYIPWNLLLLPLFLPLKRYPNFWSTKAWSPSRPVSRGSALGGYLEFQQIVSFGWNRTNVHYNHEFNEFNMNSGDLAKSVGTVFFFSVSFRSNVPLNIMCFPQDIHQQVGESCRWRAPMGPVRCWETTDRKPTKKVSLSCWQLLGGGVVSSWAKNTKIAQQNHPEISLYDMIWNIAYVS